MKKELMLHATASFGLEAVVRRELEELGIAVNKIEQGHVLFSGDEATLALANIALGASDRILIELARFPVTDFEGLYEAVATMEWAQWVSPRGFFQLDAKCVQSALHSPRDVQRIVKKAILDALRRRYPWDHFPEDGEIYPLEITIRKDECLICLNTSGEGLFKRGYRETKGAAPLKETMARGLIDLSFWYADRPLVDPFCGSGTILIEAARKTRGMDPGLDRDFAYLHWPCMEEKIFKQVRAHRLKRISWEGSLDLLGFEIDPDLCKVAHENACRAEVGDDIIFVPKDMREAGLADNFGVIITNPPYGKRLEELARVEQLMEDFRDHFLPLRTWSFFLLTALTNLEEIFGRPADRRRKLFNGGVETTYYQFHGPNPKDFI